MARALVIEDESGTCSGFLHPHNGYYAGDFHRADVQPLLTPLFARFPEQTGTGAPVLQMVTDLPWVDGHTRPRAA
jgi:hypothetical protein